MKPLTKWLACDTCGVLRHHTPDAQAMTPFGADKPTENWICSTCRAVHPLTKPGTDQAVREHLEQRGQLRLFV